MLAELGIADQHEAPKAPRELPTSTKVPLEQRNPLLNCVITKWMQIHGKTVKPKLTEEQKANLRTCFRMMDADGSGAIDADELGAAFKLLGLSVSRKEVEAMLDEVDRDGSGEVEYAEFLEIMTLQLTRLAARKDEEAAAAAKQSPAPQAKAAEEGAAAASNSAAVAAAAAAALPFDVVVTAYRRKKLMAALEEDDKEFILSVAAAEEEEREKAEREAALAKRRAHRGSVMLALQGQRGGGDAAAARLPSHGSFLASLGQEERHIIETLSKKYREELSEAVAAKQQQQQQQPSSPSRPAGAGGSPARAAHLAALDAAAAATIPVKKKAGAAGGSPTAGQAGKDSRSRSPCLRPASATLTAKDSFHVQYCMGKAAAAAAEGAGTLPAASRALAAVDDTTQGLRLLTPQFSKSMGGK